MSAFGASAARELRDRWMEEVNSGRYLPAMQGKYDVARAIDVHATQTSPLLPAPVAA